MIRHTTDTEWILIPQNAHAESCGVMADYLDKDVVGLPTSRGRLGITMHDSGWPLHDDRPTLDESGQPTHVFHTPAAITARLWAESSRRAAARDLYAGLLASIHGLHLVAFALQTPRDRQTVFEFNKFQHAQVESQESIRRQLSMRTDVALQHGLARPGIDPGEDALIRDYRTLRALDQISLAALCSETLFDKVDFTSPTSAAQPAHVSIERIAPFQLRLNPWPFTRARIDISVPARQIARQRFDSELAFLDAYLSTPERRVEFRLFPN